ncbi:HEPN domain-containing protein [Pedobacter nyackensis]|uniref:HEPN domain-containing protein n=1 Tax=Pedobacter nyackensis TaxID=475255 RepID=A0A1W2B6X0_9SPHI|nr:HEPN domain-containing protein [Pedobacter nyackensis]SMC68725.1 HEPN domain-containing protein [Pedobacter nyackensis]
MKKKKRPRINAQNNEPNTITSELKGLTNFITRQIQTEKIICFGSTIKSAKNIICFEHKEGETAAQKLNKYYILLIPSIEEKQADIVIQQRMEQELKHRAEVTIIVHRMLEINLALQNGDSFFTTIYKKGTLLHDSENEPFVAPKEGAEISKRITNRESSWYKWFELSENFLSGARFYAKKHKNSLAIFMLHQTLQHCYSGMLRVLIGYRTNSNSLSRLLKLIENVLPESKFSSAYDTPENTRLTKLLLKGFGDARYNDKFEASQEEVATLISRIEQILQDANTTCLNKIELIKQGSAPYTA